MSTEITTGTVRFSYLNVFKPRAFEGKEPEYSVTLLIPKDDKKTIRKIRDAIEEQIQEGISSKWNGKKPGGLWNPLRDGDDEKADEHPEYEGMYFVNAKSKTKPILLDEYKDEIVDETELYSGCWGRAVIAFYPFNNTLKGIGVALNALQKKRDDEPFGNRMTLDTARDRFDDDEDDDDDLL